MQGGSGLPQQQQLKPVNVPALLAGMPWTVQPSEPGQIDASNLARRVSKADAPDAVPKWDLSIVLDALSMIMWPVLPGDQPVGEPVVSTHFCLFTVVCQSDTFSVLSKTDQQVRCTRCSAQVGPQRCPECTQV